MSLSLESQAPRRRPHQDPTAAAYREFDLARELDLLRREPAWSSGRNATTLVKYDDFRLVLTALKAGERLPGHQTAARVSIQPVAGHIQVRAQGRTFNLVVGAVLALDRGVPHEVEAVEESAFLLTIAWPARAGDAIPQP